MTADPATIDDTRPRWWVRSPFGAIRRVVREQELELPALVFGLHWIVVAAAAAIATRYASRQPTVEAVGWRLPDLAGW
ncbi:MAG: hypothetical protein WEC79_07950, partial [Thermomicrobiales bacterium]